MSICTQHTKSVDMDRCSYVGIYIRSLHHISTISLIMETCFSGFLG